LLTSKWDLLLLLLGARLPPLSVDITVVHGAQQQTCRSGLANDGTDRQTDATDSALHAMRTVSGFTGAELY